MMKEFVLFYLLRLFVGEKRAGKIDRYAGRYVTRVAAVIFFIGAIVHTFRIITGFEFIIAGWLVPLWISVLVMLLGSFLAFNLWKIH